MAKVFNQKIKILYLMQMMWSETDEEHVLNMQEILTKLEEKGIRAERKSIYDDFEVLRQFGLDIRFRKSQPSGYYLGARSFSVEEVSYLMDLLLKDKQNREQAELLIEKLKNQLSSYQSDIQVELEESAKDTSSDMNQNLLTDSKNGSTPDSKAHSAEESEEEKKEIQILFKGKHMDAVLAYGGFIEEPKEHKSGLYKVKMYTAVDEKFYGWMVSQGFGIKIVKPKAEAEAYRAHLKKLFKQYK